MNGSGGTDSQSKAGLLSRPGPGSPRGALHRGRTLPFCLCPSPGSTGPAPQTSSPALALSRSAPGFPPRVWPPGDSVARVLHHGTRATASTQASERELVPSGFSNELLPLPVSSHPEATSVHVHGSHRDGFLPLINRKQETEAATAVTEVWLVVLLFKMG